MMQYETSRLFRAIADYGFYCWSEHGADKIFLADSTLLNSRAGREVLKVIDELRTKYEKT